VEFVHYQITRMVYEALPARHYICLTHIALYTEIAFGRIYLIVACAVVVVDHLYHCVHLMFIYLIYLKTDLTAP